MKKITLVFILVLNFIFIGKLFAAETTTNETIYPTQETVVDSEEERRFIEIAKKRLYPGGVDEQELEVQALVLKPQKHFGEDEIQEQEKQEEF